MSVIIHGANGPEETDLTYEACFGALCMRKDGATAAVMLRIVLDHPAWVVTGVEVLTDGVRIAFLDTMTALSGTWTAPFCDRTIEEVRRTLTIYTATHAWTYRNGIVDEEEIVHG